MTPLKLEASVWRGKEKGKEKEKGVQGRDGRCEKLK